MSPSSSRTAADSGAREFWDTLADKYPHFEFRQGVGLGVLGIGMDLAPALHHLFSLDGVHPTTSAYGIAAAAFLDVLAVDAYIARSPQFARPILTARRPAGTGPPLDPPPALVAALRRNARARAAFEAFPPSQKREYIEWIAGAKMDETRQRRLDTAVVWIADGKQRNWRYQRK